MKEQSTESGIAKSAPVNSSFGWPTANLRTVAENQDEIAELKHKCPGTVIGTITDVVNSAELLIDHPYNSSGSPLPCRTIAHVSAKDIGSQVVLVLEGGDPSRPIMLGLLRTPLDSGGQLNFEVDGESLIFNGSREVVLRCGGASITLTRSGRVMIQGEYVVTRSKGVNRIKGASVQIN